MKSTGENVLEDIEWTLDCQGKQDFDGDIVQLSSRYWPRGGGYHSMDPSSGKGWEGNETRPEIKPAAESSIYMLGKLVAMAEFEGETEAEVKFQVERWARKQIEKIVGLMEGAFEKKAGDKHG